MKCNGRIVSIGDAKSEIIAKCGEPFFQNIISVETEKDKYNNKIQSEEVVVEQMTYNQGQNTLLKILTFKGGKLINIENGDRVSGDKQNGFTASIGDSQAEIYAKYGEPFFRETISIESTKISSSHKENTQQLIEEKVEQWSYNLGPGTFLKILTFKSGKLIKIENGTRQ
jgi:hypothetical protein